jgi:hypothetical protein
MILRACAQDFCGSLKISILIQKKKTPFPHPLPFFPADMSFLRRVLKPKMEVASAPPLPAPEPSKENLAQLIDHCLVSKSDKMRSRCDSALMLSRAMTAVRVRQLTDEEYAHLIVALHYASNQGRDNSVCLGEVLSRLVLHAKHWILDHSLYEHLKTWRGEDALCSIDMLLLLAIACDDTKASGMRHLVDVLCERMCRKTVPYINFLSEKRAALFALLSPSQALLLLDRMVAYDKVYFFDHVSACLESASVKDTIDALQTFAHLWTTTPKAATSSLGVEIWKWLIKHSDTWSRALEASDATCYAPLDGWLLIRSEQGQPRRSTLPYLIGKDTTALFLELGQHSVQWARHQPEVLVDVVKRTTVSFLHSPESASLLMQAWPFLDDASRSGVVLRELQHPVNSQIALQLAIILGKEIVLQRDLFILIDYVLKAADMVAESTIDWPEFPDRDSRIYETLVLVCHMSKERDKKYQYANLMACLAMRCSEEQLCLLSMTPIECSILYIDMTRLVPSPTAMHVTTSLVVFSSRMNRAWRLHSTLAYLAYSQGWADFVPDDILSMHAFIGTALIRRKQELEQACNTHLVKDLAQVCMLYV